MLYPQLNKYRDIYHLNGIWNMCTVEDDYKPIQRAEGTVYISVPASYNEQVKDAALRDYSGKVLYEREFSCPMKENKRYRLRIGALSHKGEVWLNGELVATAGSGFLPVDTEIELKEENRLSVIIDNRLTYETLPVGMFDQEQNKQVITFDFYNYTGIHRSVMIYSVPEEWIQDITVRTFVEDNPSKVEINVECDKVAHIDVFEEDGNCVVKDVSANTVFQIENPHLWKVGKPYLYKAVVYTESDEYTLDFGIRSVKVDDTSLYVSGEKVYLKGFGRHEDFLISGKGENLPVLMNDYNLMQWAHANSFRTSHYPYGEEVYDLADRLGFLIIDEVQAAGMNFGLARYYAEDGINDKTLTLHKECVERLIARDKNHPSVIMISVANEANTVDKGARGYFSKLINYTRTLTDLPITMPQVNTCEEDTIGDLLDVTSINRYYGWYSDHGNLNCIEQLMKAELNKWYEKYHKPIIVTEFGADTVEGVHSCPPETFSEEFQEEYIERMCRAFDSAQFCIGEHVWNFADFKTKQGLTRMKGNRKGVFTRERQPKMAAHFLRRRWEQM